MLKHFEKILVVLIVVSMLSISLEGCSTFNVSSQQQTGTTTSDQSQSSEVTSSQPQSSEAASNQLLPEPDAFKLYKNGKITTCTKSDNADQYNKIWEMLNSSYEAEANTLRIDDSVQDVTKAKKQGKGLELLYNKTGTVNLPSFDKQVLTYTFDSIFIPFDADGLFMIFGEKEKYTSAPVYLKTDSKLKEIIQ